MKEWRKLEESSRELEREGETVGEGRSEGEQQESMEEQLESKGEYEGEGFCVRMKRARLGPVFSDDQEYAIVVCHGTPKTVYQGECSLHR